MPTYEYRCESCGRSFDVVQGFHDSALTTCEVCAGTLRKVFAPVGIVFKGSGFYKNDSRSSPSRPASGGSKEDASGSPAKEPAAASNGADSSAKNQPASSGSSDAGASGSSAPAPASSDGAKDATAKKPVAPKSA